MNNTRLRQGISRDCVITSCGHLLFARFKILLKFARFRFVSNKALKVNAFYYVVTLMEWLSCPEQGLPLQSVAKLGKIIETATPFDKYLPKGVEL